MTDLGTFPGGYASGATGVSANSDVVVGWSYNNLFYMRAFRWTQSTGMVDLGTLGGIDSSANAVSADGSVVVGYAYTAANRPNAFRWENNVMTNLGTLGGNESFAHAVSPEGRVVVGRAHNAAGQWRAFRWENGTMQDLGTLGGNDSRAFGVSANGSVEVGTSLNASGQQRAFRWRADTNTMEDLNLAFAHLLQGSTLEYAYAVTPDGRYIVGYGRNAGSGRYEGFLLDTVPEPASSLALGIGLVGLLMRRRPRA